MPILPKTPKGASEQETKAQGAEINPQKQAKARGRPRKEDTAGGEPKAPEAPASQSNAQGEDTQKEAQEKQQPEATLGQRLIQIAANPAVKHEYVAHVRILRDSEKKDRPSLFVFDSTYKIQIPVVLVLSEEAERELAEIYEKK